MKLILSLFVVLVAVGRPVKAHQACPPFWVAFQESCYRIFGTKLSWEDAEEQCHTYFNDVGVAHLVSVQSEAEHLFTYELWKSATGNMVAEADATFWMGLNDKDTEGTFVWTDTNEPATYTRWKAGQPDNGVGGNEDCSHSSTVDPSSPTWNDWGCNQELYYMCKLPQSS